MQTFARIENRLVQIGGEQATGWLPNHSAPSLPTVRRDVVFTFTITDDGNKNYLLCYESTDGSRYGDTWHETLAEAMECALTDFGIAEDEWIFDKTGNKEA